jgi:O-antigen/teichoic acid export membrane protein
MQNLTLKQRVLNSSIWTLGTNVISQLIRFASNLIMTRLLAPEMFGLIAVAGVVIVGIHLFSDIGLKQVLIQNKRSDKAFVNTVWTMQVVRGVMIWLVAIAIAVVFLLLNQMQLLAENSVYADPLFPFVIIAIGFNSVISGFESTKMTLAQRGLTVKLNMMIALGSQVIGMIFMLIWAFYSPTVWALVAGSIVGTMLGTIASYIVIPGEGNKFTWDAEVRSEVYHFGKWIFLSSILGFLSSSSDRLLLGGLIDAKLLGFYAIAGLLVGALIQLITNQIHSICFPALSETYRDNPHNLKSIFYKLRLPFDLASLFILGFIFVTADNIVHVLYDDRYSDVGWMLQILSISLFELRYRICGECYMAMGKVRLVTSLILLHVVFLYVFGFLAYHYYGFSGAIWLLAGSNIVTIPLNFYYLNKFELLDLKKEIIVLPVILLGVAVGFLVNFLLDGLI